MLPSPQRLYGRHNKGACSDGEKEENLILGDAREAAGADYETLVGAWYGHAVLLGASSEPPFGLPAGARLISFTCQSEATVDDVNAVTSDAGLIFVQAKRSVTLSAAPKSSFATHSTNSCANTEIAAVVIPSMLGRGRWNLRATGLCSATRSAASAKITEILPRLLRGLRDRTDIRTLVQVATRRRNGRSRERLKKM